MLSDVKRSYNIGIGVIKFAPKGYMIFLGIAMLLIAISVLLKLAPVETPSKPPDEDIITKKLLFI